MTPLNGILGFAEILKEDFGRLSPDETKQMLTDIESCAKRLHRTLMNYLQLVRFETTTDQDRPPPPPALSGDSLGQLVSYTAVTTARNSDRESDLFVSVDPVAARVHEADMRTVIEHLVENACHYSIPGSPIRVRWQSEDGRPTLRVEDRGRGMTAEQVTQIGAFVQFDRKHYEQQGLGIGLALVKRLLARQGGILRFETEENKGTTAIVHVKPTEDRN
jgi:signal transduction histidine kinase